MGADVTGTNKRQIVSAHGQAEGALHSRGRSLLLALLHRRKHRGGSEEAAGLNKALTLSPPADFFFFFLPLLKYSRSHLNRNHLTEFFCNLQQINHVPFSCRGMK